MKSLLSAYFGGDVTEDELNAMGLAASKLGPKNRLMNEEEEVSPPKVMTSFDTPASVGMDISGFMSKLPPGMSRDDVRHMTFPNIKIAIKLNEDMGVEHKTEALYRKVTETRVIPEDEDNRRDKLHPARFFPDSMAAPDVYWAKCVPLRVDPHVTGIPLAHVGLENEVAPLAIDKAGDRTKRLFIRYFLQSNVGVQQKQPKFQTQRGQDGQMGLSLDENWQDSQKVSEIQDAVFQLCFRHGSSSPEGLWSWESPEAAS